MCHLEEILLVFLVLEIIALVSAVKINKLQVPDVIQHGRPVVLDCDFTLEDTDQDLVVKWYFNSNNENLVYQWIPASKNRPQVLGVLKDRLNLGSMVADATEANSKVNRALHILHTGPDLSGDYTCSVSTLQSEDIQTKSMLVFVPEKKLMIRRYGIGRGTLNLLCTAEEVFPQPEVILQSKIRGAVKTEKTFRQRGHLYDVSVTTNLDELQEPEEFSCELKISKANYTVRRHIIVYPGYMGNKGPSAITGDIIIWIIVTVCTSLLCPTVKT